MKKKDDILMKRRAKEIAYLKSLPLGFRFTQKEIDSNLLIQIEIEKNTIESLYLDSTIRKLYFDIILDPQFPFLGPKIQTRTNFSMPSLADGRDLLDDIILKKWTPTLTLFEIVQMIPIFVSNFLENQFKKESQSTFVGKFNLGERCDINDWMTMPTCGVFICSELSGDDFKNIYIVISESVYLVFEPEERRKNFCTLIKWATLQTIHRIERNMDNSKLLTIYWRKTESSEERTEKIQIENVSQFLTLVLKNIKQVGIKAKKSVKNKTKLHMSEVSNKAVKKINISEVSEHVQILESKLEESLENDNIQELMALYSKAIEYYSAIDDTDNTSLFLKKLHVILQREDIQVVLNSVEPEKKEIFEETKGNPKANTIVEAKQEKVVEEIKEEKHVEVNLIEDKKESGESEESQEMEIEKPLLEDSLEEKKEEISSVQVEANNKEIQE